MALRDNSAATSANDSGILYYGTAPENRTTEAIGWYCDAKMLGITESVINSLFDNHYTATTSIVGPFYEKAPSSFEGNATR